MVEMSKFKEAVFFSQDNQKKPAQLCVISYIEHTDLDVVSSPDPAHQAGNGSGVIRITNQIQEFLGVLKLAN